MKLGKLFTLVLIFLLVVSTVSAATLYDKVKDVKLKYVVPNFVIAFAVLYLILNFVPGIKELMQKDSQNTGINQYIIYILMASAAGVLAWKFQKYYIWTAFKNYQNIQWFLWNKVAGTWNIRPLVNTTVVAVFVIGIKTLLNIQIPNEKDSKTIIWILAIIIGLFVAHAAFNSDLDTTGGNGKYVWQMSGLTKIENYALGYRIEPSSFSKGHTGYYCKGQDTPQVDCSSTFTDPVTNTTVSSEKRYGILSTTVNGEPDQYPLLTLVIAFIVYLLVFKQFAGFPNEKWYYLLYAFFAAQAATRGTPLDNLKSILYYLLLYVMYDKINKNGNSIKAGALSFMIVDSLADSMGWAPPLMRGLQISGLSPMTSNLVTGLGMGILFGGIFKVGSGTYGLIEDAAKKYHTEWVKNFGSLLKWLLGGIATAGLTAGGAAYAAGGWTIYQLIGLVTGAVPVVMGLYYNTNVKEEINLRKKLDKLIKEREKKELKYRDSINSFKGDLLRIVSSTISNAIDRANHIASEKVIIITELTSLINSGKISFDGYLIRQSTLNIEEYILDQLKSNQSRPDYYNNLLSSADTGAEFNDFVIKPIVNFMQSIKKKKESQDNALQKEHIEATKLMQLGNKIKDELEAEGYEDGN